MEVKKLDKFISGAIAIFCSAVAICLYLFTDAAIYIVFDKLGIDIDIYNGLFSTVSAVLIICLFLIVNRFTGKKNDRLIKFKRISAIEVVLLVVIALGLLGFVNVYMSFVTMISDYLNSFKEAMQDYSQQIDRYSTVSQTVVPLWDTILYTLTMFILIPFKEELIFRGAVFGELRKSFKPGLAIFLAAVIFGVMHGISVHIGYAFVCGLIITACYYYTDSIWASVILHAIFNFFGTSIHYIIYSDTLGIPTAVADSVMRVMTIVLILMMVPAVIAFVILTDIRKRAKKTQETVQEVAFENEQA